MSLPRRQIEAIAREVEAAGGDMDDVRELVAAREGEAGLHCQSCGRRFPQDPQAGEPYPWSRCLACELETDEGDGKQHEDHHQDSGSGLLVLCHNFEHVVSDWSGVDGKRFCGVCHPPATAATRKARETSR
jgi:hypothetical protein